VYYMYPIDIVVVKMHVFKPSYVSDPCKMIS